MELLTAKPVLYLANTDEGLVPPEGLAAHAEAQGGQALALPIGMELELPRWTPRRRPSWRPSSSWATSRGADAVVAAGYRLLDLVTFFTGSGPPEARAWPVRRGTTASEAAGRIHSDLERGFIRAEVIPWDALVAAGSFARAREEALLRMEGRDYVVQEGDVLQIRFNV